MLGHRGFTLLETMVALGIVILVIGAGAAVNHAFFASSTSSDSITHASALADEAMQDVMLTQSYIQQSTGRADYTLASYFGGLTVGQTRQLIPFQAVGGGALPNSPVNLTWCMDVGDLDGVQTQHFLCSSQVSLVGSQALSSFFPNGELIAVNRASADARSVVDATVLSGSAVSTSDIAWDFFTRKIELKSITLVAGLSGRAYQLTITVQNRDTGTKVVRSKILTDWK